MKSGLLAFALAGGLLAAGLPAAAQGQDPTTAPDWLDGRVVVRFANLTSATVAGHVDVHKVTLPGSSAQSAQNLRNSYAQAERFGAGAMLLGALEGALQERLQAVLDGVFPPGTARVEAPRVDRASLNATPGADPFHPPVGVDFAATITLPALRVANQSIDDAKARSLLDLGVRASRAHNVSALPGWNVTYTFELPSWARFAAAGGGEVSADGGTATWALANWKGTAKQLVPASLSLRGARAPAEVPTDVRLDLTIDLQDVVGLSLPGLASGDLGALQVAFDGRLVARSLRVADFDTLGSLLRDRLPPSLSIEGFNADGLRVAVAEGLLPGDALDRLEAYFHGLATERLASLVQGDVLVEGGFDPGTLDAAHVSAPLDGDPPLGYAVQASFRIPLSRERAAQGSGAEAAFGPALLQRELSFELPRIRGLDTSYRVVLPPGIALADLRLEGARAERGTQGGRDVVVVTPEGDDARATFTVAVTTGFVLTEFWYLGLGLLLLTALGVAMALNRRLRRRGKPGMAEPGPAEPETLAEAPEAAPPAAAPPAPPSAVPAGAGDPEQGFRLP